MIILSKPKSNIMLSLEEVREAGGKCKLYDHCPYQSCERQKWETNRDSCLMLSKRVYDVGTLNPSKGINILVIDFLRRR
jgi:hypothetical protein